MWSWNSQTPNTGCVATTATQMTKNGEVLLISKSFVAMVPKGHAAFSRELMDHSDTSLIFYLCVPKMLETMVCKDKCQKEKLLLSFLCRLYMRLMFGDFYALRSVLWGSMGAAVKGPLPDLHLPIRVAHLQAGNDIFPHAATSLAYSMPQQGACRVPEPLSLDVECSGHKCCGCTTWVAMPTCFSKGLCQCLLPPSMSESPFVPWSANKGSWLSSAYIKPAEKVFAGETHRDGVCSRCSSITLWGSTWETNLAQSQFLGEGSHILVWGFLRFITGKHQSLPSYDERLQHDTNKTWQNLGPSPLLSAHCL